MKKILLSGFLGLSLLFSSCNPYEDIHEQLRDDISLKTESDAIPTEISLDSTYATLEEAEVELQKYMTVTYPNANKFTEGKVTEIEYNLGLVVDAPDVIVSESHVMNHADYESVGSGKYDNFGYYDNKAGEFPEGTPVDNVLDAKIDFILKANYTSSVEGDRVEVEYEYYDNGTNTKKVVYAFVSGTWERYSNPNVVVYKLTDADYAAMGAPGAHNNFSSSVPQEDYLPQFLMVNYPYAQAKEAVNIIYYYFLGKVDGQYKSEYRAVTYVYDGTSWIQVAPLDTTVRFKSKYKYTEGVWKLSKATVILLADADYELVESGKYHNFAYYDNKPGEYPQDSGIEFDNVLMEKIRVILEKNYTDLVIEDAEVIVHFNYYDNGNSVENVSMTFKDGAWVLTDSSIEIKFE